MPIICSWQRSTPPLPTTAGNLSLLLLLPQLSVLLTISS
jgi:hypothetical protein